MTLPRGALILLVLMCAALFVTYGGPLRPAPVHWLSDRIDIPLLRD